jgi:nucleolar protein 53
LEDSLRRLKPEGNLMQERYRNLLISGKVEVRKKQWQYKQARKTRSEKWSYKDWRLR